MPNHEIETILVELLAEPGWQFKINADDFNPEIHRLVTEKEKAEPVEVKPTTKHAKR